MRTSALTVVSVGVLLLAAPAMAELPNPLSLDQALSLADQAHPDLERAGAVLDQARAEQDRVDAIDNVKVDLEVAARFIEPSSLATSIEPHNNDSWAKLRVSKRLYDFGHTDYLTEAAEAQLRGGRMGLLSARQQRRIRVMQRFFDVLLADLEQARDTEAMAIAFVRMDKARSRHELGQVSDLELLELESRYQNLLVRQRTSQAKQRATRSQLAFALNHPQQLPSDLEPPELAALKRVLGDVEPLVEAALADNPELKQLREVVVAARKRMDAATVGHGAVVRGELEGAGYMRKLGSTNPFTAAVVLEVPLSDGGERNAEADRRRAQMRRAQADLTGREYQIRQTVLDLWLDLQTLQSQRAELETLGEFRELDFDRSRAMYELEVASDLGDAMTRISEFRLIQAENDYKIALAWARLDALTGRLIGAEGEEIP